MARSLLAPALLGLAVAAGLEVHVRPNGGPLREAPAIYFVDSLDELRAKVQEAFGKDLGGDAWWIADLQGYPVTSWAVLADMPLAMRRVTVVPEGKHFQWSPGRIGELIPVRLSNWSDLELEPVAHSPRIFLMHNLFTEDEANWLIDRAITKTGPNALKQSGVGFDYREGGKRNTVNKRTSSGAFDRDSSMANRVIRRAFEALRIPFHDDLVDGLQILRYNEGQAYIPHTDWFGAQKFDGGQDERNFDTTTPTGSNRLATVFLYLHPPPSGGYTVFPKATLEEGLNDSDSVSTGRDGDARTRAVMQATKFYGKDAWEVGLVNDCYDRLSVKPKRLSASLFYHQEPMTGRLLDEALHGACPSFTGTKWGANLWIWNRPRPPMPPPPGATPVDPNQPQQPRMPPPPQPVEAIFENREEMEVTLEFSVDNQQTWQVLDKLPPRRQHPIKTFSGHAWRFLGEGGREVSKWVAQEKDLGTILVASDGTLISQMKDEL